MIRAAAVVACLVALGAWPAAAQEARLAWDDCGPSGVPARVWACDANTGEDVLVGSVVPNEDVTRFVGVEFLIGIGTEAVGMPPWWDFQSDVGCRTSAVSVDQDYSQTPSGGTACLDFFAGRGWGGLGFYRLVYEGGSDYSARLGGYWALGEEDTLRAGVEVYVFRLVIRHQQSVGPEACPGCEVGACLLFEWVNLAQPAGVGDRVAWGTTALVEWNGGSREACYTPIRRATWGGIKSLYR